ncbi:MAG: helix-turn-helix domain-containing protein [Alphaproteobacteria bacterium]
MTPFGIYIRHLREERNITLRQMAKGLDVSAAYLSALEHGWRGVPQSMLIQQICTLLNLWGDEAEKLSTLAKISDPKVNIDTGGLSPKATEFANILAKNINLLDDYTLEWLIQEIQGPQQRESHRYKLPPSMRNQNRRDFRED